MLSVRTKIILAHVLAIAAFFATFFLFDRYASATPENDGHIVAIVVLLSFIYLVIYYIYITKIPCSKCGKPAITFTFDFKKFELIYTNYTIAPKFCTKCGHDLTKSSDESEDDFVLTPIERPDNVKTIDGRLIIGAVLLANILGRTISYVQGTPITPIGDGLTILLLTVAFILGCVIRYKNSR